MTARTSEIILGRAARTGRRAICAPVLWGLLLALSSPALSFGDAPPAPSVDTVYPGFTKIFTLSDLGWERGFEFSGTSIDRTRFFGVPPSQMVERGSITLHYRYWSKKGTAVHPGIEVDLNETPLGILPYPPGDPAGKTQEQTVTFPIPPYLVTPQNSLRFRVAKDPLHPCDNVYVGPFADIRATSQLTLSGIRIHVPDRLSDLPFPFLYRSMIGGRTIPFILGGTGPTLLEAAGIVSSWLGVQAGTVPLRFHAATGLPDDFRALPTGNIVLLTTIAPSLAQFFTSPVMGPTLAMIDNPSDPFGKILLVLGRTSSEVRTAALALALGQYSSDGPIAAVGNVSLPPFRGPDDAPRWIDTGKLVRLDRISPTIPLSVSGTGSLPAGFSLPSDLFFWQTPSFPFRLHYQYTTLPGENLSRLDLLLNNRYQDSIALPPETGKTPDHRRIMPLRIKDLTPFKNVLRLNFNFQTAIPRVLSCKANMNPQLRGTILPDSALDLRSVPHFVELPSLKLFPNGGYPFTRYADQSRTAVVMPDTPGEGDIRIFLHLMAFFGEESGTPALFFSVARPDGLDGVASKNLVLIGTYDSNPLLLRYEKGLPQDTKKTRSLIRLKSRMEEIFRWSNPPPSHYGPEDLASYFKEDRGPLGVVEEEVSPLAPHRVILSLSGVSEQSLTSLDRVLFDPHHFSDIFGQVSVIGPRRIHSFFVSGPRFSLGHLDFATGVRFWFYSHPLGVMLVALATSLLSGFILYRILLQIAARRLRS